MAFLRQLSRSSLLPCTCSGAFSNSTASTALASTSTSLNSLIAHSFFSTSSTFAANGQRGWDKRGSASSSQRQRPRLNRSRTKRAPAEAAAEHPPSATGGGGARSFAELLRPSHPTPITLRALAPEDDAPRDRRRELPPDAPGWRVQKEALKDKFPQGWSPAKRLSREAMDLIRVLVQEQPEVYTTAVLAERFKVSPEAIRRIVKSRFSLPQEEREKREEKRRERRREEVRQREEGGAEGGRRAWAGDVAGEEAEILSMRRRAEEAEPRERRRDN